MVLRVVADRETALRLGYEANDWSAPIAFDDYRAAMQDWTVQVITKNEHPIGAIFNKDGEIHVAILPSWRKRWATRRFLNEILPKGTRTRVAQGHEYMYDVLARLGFVLCADGALLRENYHGH
jgi:hypothetical protein